MSSSSSRTLAHVTTLAPNNAAATLERALTGFHGELTIADAAARGGLALRDAEVGLHALVARYHGHLAATEKGELVFRFPNGLVRPEGGPLRRLGRRFARGARGVGRFLVRAWVSVVLVGYAATFAAILIGVTLSDRDRERDFGDALAIVGRLLFEALYWTFHPFSPFAVTFDTGPNRAWMRGRRAPRVPFYERVNRFVFGPVEPAPDPRQQRARVLDDIRRLRGRVGLGDLTQTTGLPRGQVDALASSLLLDLDGTVEVTDEGSIVYGFAALRPTAADERNVARNTQAPDSTWRRPRALPPLTGNTAGSNLLFAALNGFNLAGSGFALTHGLTIDRLLYEIAALRPKLGEPLLPFDGPPGIPWLLGVIPFVFSAAVFMLPFGRALARGRRRRALARDNGRRAVLAAVLDAASASNDSLDIPRDDLARAYKAAAGREPSERELADAARGLDGDLVVLDDGQLIYRFATLADERRALARLRAATPDDEARPGAVVFSSDA